MVALLGGCAVGPNYHAPKTEISPAFTGLGETNVSDGPAAVTWWSGFKDQELDTLVSRALATNQDLRIATARVREARALRSGAIAGAFPVVQGVGGFSKSVSSADSLPFSLSRQQRELELYNVGFDATWELDIFGGVRRSIEAGNAVLAATEAQRQDVLVTLIAEVARNYFELRGHQNTLAVAHRNADNQRETLELTMARSRAGRATDLDIARARAQWNATAAAVPLVEAAIQHSIYRLSVLLGLQPAVLEPELAPAAPIPAMQMPVQIGNPADLLRRRADVRAAERSLAAATAGIGIETANLFPRVFFNGNIGFSANHLSTLGQAGNDTYSFGPQITWSAFDSGHVRARIQAAHARADAELASYEKTVLESLEETENALVDFGREQVRRDFLRDSVRAAGEAMALARQRYEAGVADFLPVLDAERTQLDVEAQLALSETRTATSLVAIYKALGGGWEMERNQEAAK